MSKLRLNRSFTLIVGAGYSQAAQLAKFKELYGHGFMFHDPNIIDPNFRQVAKLLPNQKLTVQVNGLEPGTTCTENEYVNYLHQTKAIPTGPYGLALVYAQARDVLEQGKNHCCPDQEDLLWHDASDMPRIPFLMPKGKKNSIFGLRNHGVPFTEEDLLLSFRIAG